MPNRLAQETSPYLLQHKDNPVDWYPWGDEAFERARSEDRPVFLSIGYSACHWCHVMERESFENDAIAALMNEHFVNIKVDREERPDVDSIYMSAVQAMTGRGGWPMSIFLVPDTLEPIVAGTYFPAEAFTNLLSRVSDAWVRDEAAVRRQANQLAQMVTQQLTQASWTRALGRAEFDRGMSGLMGSYDIDQGGFGGGRNKFPMPAYLELFTGAGWHSPKVQEAVTFTLERMARGGMYDQIGGGFHRYSTDAKWLVPHFEKMLYDQGQLLRVYAETWRRTGRCEEALIWPIRETVDFLRREMTAPDGGYYASLDADSEGEEGKFYVWKPDEVARVLGEERAAAFDAAYGVTTAGNFEGAATVLRETTEDPRDRFAQEREALR